jgi:hypothetical protein
MTLTTLIEFTQGKITKNGFLFNFILHTYTTILKINTIQ